MTGWKQGRCSSWLVGASASLAGSALTRTLVSLRRLAERAGFWGRRGSVRTRRAVGCWGRGCAVWGRWGVWGGRAPVPVGRAWRGVLALAGSRRSSLDAVDGEAAAGAALSGEASVVPKGNDGIVESFLLITAGDNPGRLPSEASLAALREASPVEASSDKTARHRLNPGAERQANHALRRTAMARPATSERTRAYAARRQHPEPASTTTHHQTQPRHRNSPTRHPARHHQRQRTRTRTPPPPAARLPKPAQQPTNRR